MTKRDAKQQACRIIHDLIKNSVGEGWTDLNYEGNDGIKIENAMMEVVAEMARRGGMKSEGGS